MKYITHIVMTLTVVMCVVEVYSQTTSDQVDQRRLASARNFRRDLAFRLEDHLLEAQDVTDILKLYFKGRTMKDTAPLEQMKLYLQGMELLKKQDFKPIPPAEWPDLPEDVPLALKESFTVPKSLWEDLKIPEISGVTFRVVEYTVDGLKLYAVLTESSEKGEEEKRPMIIFAHGAAFGVPDYMLPWMARLADAGYTVAAPAFRGQPLLSRSFTKLTVVPNYTCEGTIENLDGEVNDLLGLAVGLQEKGLVRKGKYAITGHSFGSGAGLLAAARTDRIACVVSYDAWMTDPFRFYWERLANEGAVDNKSYLWGSWEDYANLPAADQLTGLMRRSVIHHAKRIKAPLLLFTGGGYNGSAYHYAHKAFVKKLQDHDKTVRYEIMPGGGHNFVLYANVEPALTAYKIQMTWLDTYFPAKPKK